MNQQTPIVNGSFATRESKLRLRGRQRLGRNNTPARSKLARPPKKGGTQGRWCFLPFSASKDPLVFSLTWFKPVMRDFAFASSNAPKIAVSCSRATTKSRAGWLHRPTVGGAGRWVVGILSRIFRAGAEKVTWIGPT